MAKQSTYSPLLENAKDLSREAPRSPKQRLGGYAVMARMIDKGRATIAGNAGEYHFACQLDQSLFTFKGVSADEVRDVLESGAGDEEILDWFNRHGTPKTAAEIKAWSDKVEAQYYYSNPEKRDWFVDACQKAGLDPKTTTLFEYLDADDQQSFAKTKR